MKIRGLALAALVLAPVLAACSRGDFTGPPDIRLGRDECGECKMIISEDRSSAAMLIERGGRREYVLFDDIGCLLDFRRDHDDFTEVQSFVHDYSTGAWVAGPEAWYVFADRKKLLTPMGTGMAAFASEDRARSAQAEYGGEIMRMPELSEARRKWLEALYGRSDPG